MSCYQHSHYQLAETQDGVCSGICPRCGKPWASDPEQHCDCTRPESETLALLNFLSGQPQFSPARRPSLALVKSG
jgi:hypothetical protein